MPVCEFDPWRMQYFENFACPDDVKVPTEDGDAWLWYPEHKWIFGTLTINGYTTNLPLPRVRGFSALRMA